MDSTDSISGAVWDTIAVFLGQPLYIRAGLVLAIQFVIFALVYVALLLVAPFPRPPRLSEKQYITVTELGDVSPPAQLACWHDRFTAAQRTGTIPQDSFSEYEQAHHIVEPECLVSLVIPAYNEEKRLVGMLEEAVEYLEQQYSASPSAGTKQTKSNGASKSTRQPSSDSLRGWEIILVSDGSTDDTVSTALDFTRKHIMNKSPSAPHGPWTDKATPTRIPQGAIRVVTLEENRGKGGAVTHGMRHARGAYIVFADADGASRFTDLGKLIEACDKVKDEAGRAVGVGSRAHMVGTEAVVKRSALRNLLMRGFHLLIWTLTTPRTAQIRDTQCGFKLFTRPALPYIIPFMHSEGWIFDVEMLMLAESAEIPMVEVPIGWKEVTGSKLNVIKDSIGMAVGLAMLRICWGIGIYRRD